MIKKLSRIVALAALAAVSTALAAGSAGATSSPVSVSLAGTETVIDESAGTFAIHGSLLGTWYTTKFVPRFQSDSQFVATGKERFVGCLDSNANLTCDAKEPSGSLKFTFIYWASFDPASGALIHGQCTHPILSGTGSFRDSAGVIFMEDKPVGDTVETTYTGTLVYQAPAPKSGHAAAKKRALASASAGGHGGACGS